MTTKIPLTQYLRNLYPLLAINWFKGHCLNAWVYIAYKSVSWPPEGDAVTVTLAATADDDSSNFLSAAATDTGLEGVRVELELVTIASLVGVVTSNI